jgi:hypothetical protein
MAEKDKTIKEAAKKAAKGEDSKDKENETPDSGPMGGGSPEVNESAGSKVKA